MNKPKSLVQLKLNEERPHQKTNREVRHTDCTQNILQREPV